MCKAGGKRAIDWTKPLPETEKKPKVRSLWNYIFVCQNEGSPTGKNMWNISAPDWAISAEKAKALAEKVAAQADELVFQQGTTVHFMPAANGKPPYMQCIFFSPKGYDDLRNLFVQAMAGDGVQLGPTKNIHDVKRPTLNLGVTDVGTYVITGHTKFMTTYLHHMGGDKQEDGTVLFSEEDDINLLKQNLVALADRFGYGVRFNLDQPSAPPAPPEPAARVTRSR